MKDNIINKLREKYGTSYKWIGIFTLVTFIKQFLIEGSMDVSSKPIWIIAMNIFIIWALYTITLLLPDKFRIKGLLIMYTTLSFIMFSDLVHYRYFQAPISIYSFYSAGQVAAVADSVKSLIKTEDVFIFIDIVLIGFILKNKNVIISKSIKDEKLVALVVSILLIFSVVNLNKLNFSNDNYTINQLGLLNYHAHDIATFFGSGTVSAQDMDDYLRGRNEGIGGVEDRKAYGLAKGRNVFVIQMESVQNLVINKEVEGKAITPVLNEMLNNDTIYFDRYYQQLGRGNTSDAEFVSHNSLYPSMRSFSYKEYEGKEFYTLPIALKNEGYSTIAFHGNEPNFWNRKNIYPSQGLDLFISEEELEQDEIIGLGVSDGSVFKQSIDYYKNLAQPFYSFFVTLTSHHPFIMPPEHRGLNLDGELKDTSLGNYMESVNYFDKVLGEFIEDLKKEGLYENSVIVLYGDHLGLDIREEEVSKQVSNYLGREYRYDDLLNVSLIVHIPGSGVTETISTAGGQVDFFPTMLNLLGIESASQNLIGQDIINAKKGFTAHQTFLTKGSFIDDEKVFEMSRDGKFENSRAWYIDTGEPVDLELCREGYEMAIREINLSNFILDNNINNEKGRKINQNINMVFTDTVDHWAEEAIEYMAKNEVVSGQADGRFNPDEHIKKSELLKTISALLDWEINIDIGGDWHVPYVNAAISKGVILDKEYDNSFNPDDSISLQDTLLWIERAMSKDISKYKHNLEVAQQKLDELKLESNDKITRAEAMVMLYYIIVK